MATSLSPSQEDLQYCRPLYHQFCTAKNTYVFKEKDDGGLILKIFNASKERFFKKDLQPEDLNLFSSSAEKIEVSSILPRYQYSCLEVLSILANKHILPLDEEKEILSFQTIQQAPIPPQNHVPEMAFGAADWEKCFGWIVEEPPLPSNIHELLAAPSSLNPYQSVADTHLLVLITAGVSLRSLGIPRSNNYRADEGDLQKQTPTSYWVLMPRNILPDTSRKLYRDQLRVLEGSHYRIPTLLEAGICMEAYRNKTGEPFPYKTNCLDPFPGSKFQYQVNGQGMVGKEDIDSGILGIWRLT